ncbi:MAG: FMN-binding protein [Treponema sp.]|nr:FMN-binding protein [Treponema sp.]
MKRLVFVAFAAMAVFSMAACSGGLDKSIWAASGGPLAYAGGPQSFRPGVFSGKGSGGMGGDIYVDVTFSDSAILGIEVTAHKETAGLGDSIFDHVISLMLARQSADVDAVAGVTLTSKAFIAAVADAISQAYLGGGAPPKLSLTPGVFSGKGSGGMGGDIYVSVTVSEDAILGIEVTAHKETAGLGDSIFDHMISLILARQSAAVDAVAGVTLTSKAFIAAVADALANAASTGGTSTQAQTVVIPTGPFTFTPGVYSGVGTGGFHGNIYVNVTVSEDGILGVEVTAHEETPDIGGAIIDDLVSSTLALQSLSFDAVAGATFTSKAFVAAVADALNQAIVRSAGH